MAPPFYPILFLLVFLLNPPHASCSCTASDRRFITMAFRYVSSFQLPSPNATAAPGGGCSLLLPSRNLTGTISWAYLRNVSALRTIDLSGNALDGSVPGSFWSAPTLRDVNFAANRFGGALRFGHSPTLIGSLRLSGNRFSSAAGLDAMPGLEVLDLSRNSLVVVPVGLAKLRKLRHLDLSLNNMRGVFPDEFPLFGEGFDYLNVSCNKLTGVVKPEVEKKFGMSAFIEPGSLKFLPSASTGRRSSSSPSPLRPTSHKKKQRRGRVRKLGFFIAGIASAIVVVLASVICVVCAVIKRRRKNSGKKCEKEETAVPQEVRWVAEAMQSAPVVLFEKPLMELMFADLAKATSGFGKESQLAEGHLRGPAFRAVLPGDMHLVARVEEAVRDAEERSAADYFLEIARLRHPNLLPLLGYCIPGKQKIALYEYMERGDLHRWLHELPAGQPNVEDWSGDTWEGEQPVVEDKPGMVTAAAPSAEICDWPTRHRIALGVARGLAFLHQGWVGNARGVAHGHVVPSNILLGDDFEPRVADYGGGIYQGTAEGDVYDFGVVVMELVTGRDGWSEEAVSWARGLVRGGRAADAVDTRLRLASPKEEKEVVECFRVGYLCTAPNPEKRPTMQQVVGLLKDVRSGSSGGGATTSSIFRT